MESADYRANAPDRCYHCKSELFEVLGALRDELGFDARRLRHQHRRHAATSVPGHRAADERGVLSPFLDVGALEGRRSARSRAPRGCRPPTCPPRPASSSRLPYGTEVTPERLRQVGAGEERAARARLPPAARAPPRRARARRDRSRASCRARSIPGWRARIVAALKPLGFRYVALDLEGYRTGALNEVLAGGSSRREPRRAALRAIAAACSCAGAPRDLGLDQGRAARDAIRADARAHGLPARRDAARARAALRRGGARSARALARDLARHFPHLAERAAGLAAGAGVAARLRSSSARPELDADAHGALRCEARRRGDALELYVAEPWPLTGFVARRARPDGGYANLGFTRPAHVGSARRA